jgi:TonB family protein
LKETETSGIKLECLKSAGSPLGPDKTYCLAADKPFVRIISSAMAREQILHNRILAFHDHFIAGDLQFVLAGRQRLTAHVESIESLNPIDEAMFTPPADAVFVPRLVNISSGVAQGMLLQKVVPEYPLIARRDHVTGTVVIQATIDKDGHIRDLQVVSGPSELQSAAMDSVRHWLYRPYVLNGEPLDVQTTINVIFTLSR